MADQLLHLTAMLFAGFASKDSFTFPQNNNNLCDGCSLKKLLVVESLLVVLLYLGASSSILN